MDELKALEAQAGLDGRRGKSTASVDIQEERDRYGSDEALHRPPPLRIEKTVEIESRVETPGGSLRDEGSGRLGWGR